MMNLQVKWILLKVIDVLACSVSIPLGFKAALEWDNQSSFLNPYMVVLIVLSILSLLISWWVAERIRDRSS